jgi:outer membrane receptor for ferrienterochelin and colicins
LGYKGIITKELFVTVDAYYNRRSNFISNPLGGLAPGVYTPLNYGNRSADSMFEALVLEQLRKTNPNAVNIPISRLSIDPVTGKAAFIVTPTNIGLVNEYGVEIGANYYVNDYVLLSADYAWLGTEVVENTVSANKILPNTSPHRITLNASYTVPQRYDVGVQFRYVEGFQWIAGLIEGSVPSYAVLNINAGYNVMEKLRLGVNIFNALDRRHYQIFGGTILQRYTTATLSYEF